MKNYFCGSIPAVITPFEKNFEIDLDSFTKLSINNMLSELDPYTSYMEKEEKDWAGFPS